METASAILKDEPAPLGNARPGAPDLLRNIVKKALAKDPLDRYQSIHDVRNDLRELAVGRASSRALVLDRGGSRSFGRGDLDFSAVRRA